MLVLILAVLGIALIMGATVGIVAAYRANQNEKLEQERRRIDQELADLESAKEAEADARALRDSHYVKNYRPVSMVTESGDFEGASPAYRSKFDSKNLHAKI